MKFVYIAPFVRKEREALRDISPFPQYQYDLTMLT